MMAIVMSVKTSGIVGMPATVFKVHLHGALEEVGKRWRDKWLPEHFKNSATTRYGYEPRKGERGSGRNFIGSYTWKKLKTKKHTKPLVWSGDSMRDSLRTNNIKATGTAGNSRVSVVLPSTFNRRHPNSRVRMFEEVTSVIKAEQVDLQKFFVWRLEVRLNKANKAKARFKTAA